MQLYWDYIKKSNMTLMMMMGMMRTMMNLGGLIGSELSRDVCPSPGGGGGGISAAVSVAANHNICPQATHAHLLQANSQCRKLKVQSAAS